MIIQSANTGCPEGLCLPAFQSETCPQCGKCKPAVEGVGNSEKKVGFPWIRVVFLTPGPTEKTKRHGQCLVCMQRGRVQG